MALQSLNQDNFSSAVLESKLPVLVEFSAPWCVYCRRIGPALERLSEKLAGQVVLGQIDIDEQPALADRYQVEVIPTLYLFQAGEHGEKLVAPASQAQVESWIREQIQE